MNKTIEILGTGIALPKRRVTSTDIDREMGYPIGHTEKKCGVRSRYYSNKESKSKESASDLACTAIMCALENANIELDEVDCILSASGTMEQAIPYTGAKIHSRLPLTRPIPSFDINMTCLSALTALDIAASMITLGQYKNIIVCASDIASVGVNWEDIETGGLFGDGAAAIVLGPSQNTNKGVRVTKFSTYSQGAELCQIRGGGSLHHPSNVDGDYLPYGMFEMQGKELYKLTAKVIDQFCLDLFAPMDFSIEDIDWVVPHQASKLALEHLQKKLCLPPEKVVNILADHGNQIAASIPTALHYLLASGKTKSGDKLLLIGTSAGVSLGGMVLEI